MPINDFDTILTPLNNGITVIEASAGTGKTYTIAMLVLRFVVEKDFAIEQLLVVTFTNAATKELKNRIRIRLSQAKELIHQADEHGDWAIQQWLKQLSLPRELILERLNTALLNIDQASVFTIHSFCQQMLSHYALETGQLFNVELITNDQNIRQYCTHDYWRKQLYPRTPLQVSLLISEYKTPDALLDSLAEVTSFVPIIPKTQHLNTVLLKIEALIQQAKAQFIPLFSALSVAFSEGKFKKVYQKNCLESKESLQSWLEGNALIVPAHKTLMLFSEQGITEGLNAGKFRATKTENSDSRKANYLKKFNLDKIVFADLSTALSTLSLQFRLGLIEALKISLQAELQRLNQLTFDDLIHRLSTALQHENAQSFIATLQHRFQVALIDEFQDTDDQQWTIFKRVFSEKSHFMYLIGDPKQAIYKFRGADIFSYFAAKETANETFTLAKNWRSHPHLITATNHLFSADNAFLFEKLTFHPVTPALSAEDGEIYEQQQPIAPMSVWQLDKSDSVTGDWTAGKAAKVIKTAVINEILSLLIDKFTLKEKTQTPPIKPKSITILVRTNTQARDYQQALHSRNIPAVINSTESVFTAPQAFEIYQVLCAVETPHDITRLKQALTLDWFGLSGQFFYELINNDIALEAWVSRFNDYHTLWQQDGFMVMISRLLSHEKVNKHLAKLPLAERNLSNLHHLIELVQLASVEQQLNMEKTIGFLKEAIQNPHQEGNDEQQLRLESDEEAVKIMTMHRSKGLEFDIVFCPFIWQSSAANKKKKTVVQCHVEGQVIQDLGSSKFDTHQKYADNEQLAEDVRILYVTLTRAKYRCYLAWANVRTKDVPNQSAFASLMGLDKDNFQDQTQKLKTLNQQYPAAFSYQMITPEIDLTRFYPAQTIASKLTARSKQRIIKSDWQISSYTALSALSSEDQADETLASLTQPLLAEEIPFIELPKGAPTGNVIHHLLEFNAFKKLADPNADFELQRDQACQRYGLQLEQPDILNQLLETIVTTPLSLTAPDFCLKNINPWECLKEMPFYLAINPLNLRQLNRLLATCPVYQPLYEKNLDGYLTGFIDLICEYQGCYYVMDYKSNFLENYAPENLQTAMHKHNYGLQYWLYSVVLHLYLQQRLPTYDYYQHFGGVHYLFVRGMNPQRPLSGVYTDRPALKTLNALATLMVYHP
jgi:exodeoxyribonuclease V beta subunit